MDKWKIKLQDKISSNLEKEISDLELQMELMRRNEIDPRIFAETRLRRGIYGQRYDNGKRDDGKKVRTLKFPCGDLKKGPDTVWDAPGMLRIKNPYGVVTSDQLIIMSDLAEEYADGVLHVTTRQDIQYHYVHIEDMPSVMRRLASVGITTKEACGNVVRNVTACSLAGVCKDEAFDVTPYSKALTEFLLGHPDCQDFGRKFKIAFSGCKNHACGLVKIHDFGALAVNKHVNGKIKRGFKLYVGGGLGAVPQVAKVFDEFISEEELLPIAQAIGRVFARLGEKKNRNKARLKFLVNSLGIVEFKQLVEQERKILPFDERWTQFLTKDLVFKEKPFKEPNNIITKSDEPEFDHWISTNVYPQRQKGYSTVTITLPLGDISSYQGRKLAQIASKYIQDTIRLTVEQNVVLRWVSNKDLPKLYSDLMEIKLHYPDASSIVDIVACPGSDTCKLGIASSRGLADELRKIMSQNSLDLDKSIKNIRIKVSGCFNSCAQHHIADIGFYGNSRNMKGYKVPHFQVVLGGTWSENCGSYGMAIGAVPSKNIPSVLTELLDTYVNERENISESFQDFVQRVGKKQLRTIIEQFMKIPTYKEDASYYSDWGDSREFSLGDIRVGECAGEIVTREEFELQKAEREVFNAQLALEENNFEDASCKSFNAMIQAARALVRIENYDVKDSPKIIMEEFKERFFDTKVFFDKYAKGKFGRYLFERFNEEKISISEDVARQQVEESQLFIEASFSCYSKISEGKI